jgi:hypothetical protein
MKAEKLYRAPQILSRRVGDETILVHTESGEIFSLNRTLSRLWDHLERGVTRDRLASLLAEEFAVDLDGLQAKLDQILAELLAKGLLTKDGPGEGQDLGEKLP